MVTSDHAGVLVNADITVYRLLLPVAALAIASVETEMNNTL